MFCVHCDKEVVIYTVSLGAASSGELSRMREQLQAEGKLVLFNPPPVGTLHCPRCRKPLQQDKEEEAE